jgi:hypothetical protein
LRAEHKKRSPGKEAGTCFADYLRTAVAAATSWQLALTIRTDSFPELQGHRRFQGLEAHLFDLRALSVFRFESVVEAPAQRYRVTVAPALVDALMDDAPKQDALPLLAFALQRLWRQYAASGTLTKDHYDKVGGLKGLIMPTFLLSPPPLILFFLSTLLGFALCCGLTFETLTLGFGGGLAPAFLLRYPFRFLFLPEALILHALGFGCHPALPFFLR